MIIYGKSIADISIHGHIDRAITLTKTLQEEGIEHVILIKYDDENRSSYHFFKKDILDIRCKHA